MIRMLVAVGCALSECLSSSRLRDGRGNAMQMRCRYATLPVSSTRRGRQLMGEVSSGCSRLEQGLLGLEGLVSDE